MKDKMVFRVLFAQPSDAYKKARLLLKACLFLIQPSRGGPEKRRKDRSRPAKTRTQTPLPDLDDKNYGYKYGYNFLIDKINGYFSNLSKEDVIVVIIDFLKTPDSELYRG